MSIITGPGLPVVAIIKAFLNVSAKKPMIYAGGGVILGKASNDLVKLTKHLNFPITNTLMGLGAYPSSDKQFLGMLGMSIL